MKMKVRKNSFWVLLFLVIVLLCMTAPLYAVYSPTEVDLGSVLQNRMQYTGLEQTVQEEMYLRVPCTVEWYHWQWRQAAVCVHCCLELYMVESAVM